MDEHYRRSHAKTTDVECCICCKTLLQQNYQTHLKIIHPYEDSNDLRPRDQKTLLSFFLESHQKKSRADTCTQSLESRKSTRNLLAQVIKKVDELTVEVRRGKK